MLSISTWEEIRNYNYVYACFIDFRKAFDTVWHDALFLKLAVFFIIGKTWAETWNFSLPKKLDLRKNKRFRDRLSSFCSTYPNICDRTKKIDYRCILNTSVNSVNTTLESPGASETQPSVQALNGRVQVIYFWVGNSYTFLCWGNFFGWN
jgi:hypothetical protein